MSMYPIVAAEDGTLCEFIESYYADYVTGEQRQDPELFESALNNDNVTARHQIVEFLITQGLDVTRVDSEGVNLLHDLAYHIDPREGGDLELFRKLLEWGCDPNQRSSRLGTPFDAVNQQMGCVDTVLMPFVDLLVEYGFDVCAPGLAGKTPVEMVRQMAANTLRQGDFRNVMLARLEELTQERCG